MQLKAKCQTLGFIFWGTEVFDSSYSLLGHNAKLRLGLAWFGFLQTLLPVFLFFLLFVFGVYINLSTNNNVLVLI